MLLFLARDFHPFTIYVAEEELFASQTGAGALSFTFPVASDASEQGAPSAAAGVPVLAAASAAGGVSSTGGQKRSRPARPSGEPAAAASSVSEAASASGAGLSESASGPRPPQFRHVFAFPAAALPACVRGMEGVVAAAAAAAGVSPPVGEATVGLALSADIHSSALGPSSGSSTVASFSGTAEKAASVEPGSSESLVSAEQDSTGQSKKKKKARREAK